MEKNVIITEKARIKMVKARAGDIDLPKIKKMVFGSGGVDAQGAVVPPGIGQTALTAQIFEKDIESHTYPVETTCRYICTLSEADCAEQSISEIALKDADGDLVAIKTFLPKGKDGDLEMTFYLDDIF